MRRFHVVIRALPSNEPTTAEVQIGKNTIETLSAQPMQQTGRLNVTFETAYNALESLPRMYIELDGSFVWVSTDSTELKWQVDGNLYDRDGSLISIDLKGTCDRENLARLLDIFRVEKQRLMVELVTSAVFVHEAEFLRLYC